MVNVAIANFPHSFFFFFLLHQPTHAVIEKLASLDIQKKKKKKRKLCGREDVHG